ncbi:MAG: DUF429 domain-containing protein [Chloroflexi bacterium]|nr:DUF429 domain-containing protein [Chloroflexota bacterium]
MTSDRPRVLAIDWSGAASGARKKIVLAEADGGRLVGLPEDGRTREGIADHVITLANKEPHLVVGLDFAFSLPAWFLQERRLGSGPDLWALAAADGEMWLADCKPPFWGRPGKTKPDLPAHFRDTEREAAEVVQAQPKSVFQIHGAGTVGTGSIRGMPVLKRLQEAGFSIWPFDPPNWPLVIEIWPRAFYQRKVKKSAKQEREAYLRSEYPVLGGEQFSRCAATDDAFDAAVSALVMSERVDELTGLPLVSDRTVLLEGVIWYPGWADQRT